MKKDLFSRYTDLLHRIYGVEELPEDTKEEVRKAIEVRDNYYQKNRQYVRKERPSP